MHMDSPCYAVIFSSRRSKRDDINYAEAAKKMVQLASNQKGFIGMENVQDNEGCGIMVSYWDSLEAIKGWNKQSDHKAVRKNGRETWYDQFTVRICRVEHMYDFQKGS